ncbi:hypothetical protein ACFX1X_035928 [Malus domestica]
MAVRANIEEAEEKGMKKQKNPDDREIKMMVLQETQYYSWFKPKRTELMRERSDEGDSGCFKVIRPLDCWIRVLTRLRESKLSRDGGKTSERRSDGEHIGELWRNNRSPRFTVEKEMGTVQDSRSGSASQAEKEEVDSRSIYVGNVDYHVLLRKSRRPFIPAAPFYPAFGYGRVPRFRRPWRKIPRVGLAWVTGQLCCPAQQAQWVQEIQGPRDLVLRSAAVEHRRHRRLVLHGIPQTLRRLHQSPVAKGARDLSQLRDVREDRFGREDHPNPDGTLGEKLEYFGIQEKDYKRRTHRARPCLLPAPVQRELLLIVREQGKVSARLSQKIRDRVQKWYQDEGPLQIIGSSRDESRMLRWHSEAKRGMAKMEETNGRQGSRHSLVGLICHTPREHRECKGTMMDLLQQHQVHIKFGVKNVNEALVKYQYSKSTCT